MKAKIRKWLRKWLLADEEKTLTAAGAILMQELHASRTFRRKISGTRFEQRIKDLLNDTK